MKDINEALKGLRKTFREPAVDIEAGRRRLREAARRLHDDPVEARRIDDLAKLVDRYEKDYRRAEEALRKEDFDQAEPYLRRAAQHGNDEAAFRLAKLLEMRSLRHDLKGHSDKAGTLAAEAREWRRRARESGIAEALEETPAYEALPQPEPERLRPEPAEPKGPRRDHSRPDGRGRKDVPAPFGRRVPSGREDGYGVGLEVLPYQFTAVLVDRSGEIISRTTGDLPDMEAEAVVSVLAAAAREIVASELGHGFPPGRVALGVQLGGPIDTGAGIVHFFSKHPPGSAGPSEFKWEDFPLGPRLEQETGFRTVVVNDAVAFAERERWLGVGRETGDFVVMLIREGVGGAIVSDGEHFKGPVEIGNFRYSSASFAQSDADQWGVLEVDGGITGVATSATEHVGRPIPDLGTAAAAADEDGPGHAASLAFMSAGIAVAIGLSYLVQFAGPSHVVLYAPEPMLSSDRRAGRAFLGQVKKFREAVSFNAFSNCELVLRPVQLSDGAQGAALAALCRCFKAEPAASAISTGV